MLKSSQNKKSIALLIPCFNGLQHLPALLEEVEKIDGAFEEIIVYDDASSDPFPFNPREKFPHIQFHEGNDNHGSGYARNRLVELSSAQYLHFHDIDDTYFPKNFLSGLIPYLAPDTVAFSSWEIHWQEEDTIQKFDYPNFSEIQDFCDFFVRGHIHLNAAIYPRNMVLKTGFNEEFRVMQDLVFNIDLACNGAKFRHNPAVITKHFKNSASTLGKIQSKKFLDYRIKYCQYCLENLPEPIKPRMQDATLHFAWDAYLKDCNKQAQDLITIAQQFGPLNYRQFGKVVEIVASIIGIQKTLHLRKYWFNLKNSFFSSG